MESLELLIKYGIYPLFLALCKIGWGMYKKQEKRIDNVEEQAHKNEKDIVEIKTGFQSDIKYMSRDIKEIKEMLNQLMNDR